MDGLVKPQQSTLDNNGSNNGAVSVSLLRAPKSAAAAARRGSGVAITSKWANLKCS